MKLNGWQRLYVLFAVPWLIGCTALLWIGVENRRNEPHDDLWWLYFGGAILPTAFAYVFGLGIAWVRRGFRGR